MQLTLLLSLSSLGLLIGLLARTIKERQKKFSYRVLFLILLNIIVLLKIYFSR